MTEYVDAREIHPDFTTIPCMECDDEIRVSNRFAYTHDEWYCRACKPDRLKDVSYRDTPSVNL